MWILLVIVIFIFGLLLEWVKFRHNTPTHTAKYKSEPLTPYQFFLGSKEWGAIRDNLFSLRGRQCERCQSIHNIQVHHLNYSKPWGQEEPEDLEILCETCHSKEHGI